jgi:flagellar protein FlaG
MEVNGNTNNAPILPENRKPGLRTPKQTAPAKGVAVGVLTAEAAPNKPPVKIEKIVTDLERISLAFNKKLRFQVDHKDHDLTVKVIDPETDKVIKELPPKELERLRDHIRETIGILFDVQI